MNFEPPKPLPPLTSYNPKVDMDPKVYYKTQASAYDRLIVGAPLTDEDIERYERERNKVSGKETKSGVGDADTKRNNRAARRKGKQVLHELQSLLGLP